VLLANDPRRVEAPRRPCGRHPDVDDDEVRGGVADEREQLPRVSRLTHHLDAEALEQTGQAFAEQDVVLGDDHPEPGSEVPVTDLRPIVAVGQHRHGKHYRLACASERAARTSPKVRAGPDAVWLAERRRR
jgi:hypothetical protein